MFSRDIIRLMAASGVRISAMIAAYLDESGHPKSAAQKVLTLGGIVADSDACEQLAEIWAAILTKHKIKEFKASDLQAHRGEFCGWTGEREMALASDVVTCVKDLNVSLIGTAVILDDWRNFSPELQHLLTNAWSLCLQLSLLELIEIYADSTEKIAVYYDEQNEFAGQARDTFWFLHKTAANGQCLASITEGVSGTLLQLQAADAVAFEVRKLFDAVLDNRVSDIPRWPMKQWLPVKNIYIRYFNPNGTLTNFIAGPRTQVTSSSFHLTKEGQLQFASIRLEPND